MTSQPHPKFFEAFGEDAEKVQGDMQAMANLVTMYGIFSIAPPDSAQELQYEEMLDRVVTAMTARPDKVIDMFSCILPLIHHMRMGHSFLDFFKDTGVEVAPIINEITGERR